MLNCKPKEHLIICIILSFMGGCSAPIQQTATPVQHADSFYNVKENDYPLLHLPFIKPLEAEREDGRTPWRMLLFNGPYVKVPDRKGNYIYVYAIEELDKFAVSDGVVMAYSAYIDKNADIYIQEHFFHWFVAIPRRRISEGFTTEDEFSAYINDLGITNPQ